LEEVLTTKKFIAKLYCNDLLVGLDNKNRKKGKSIRH
jgi:hypothetical protein